MSSDFVQIPRSEIQRLIDSLKSDSAWFGKNNKIELSAFANNTLSIIIDMVSKAEKRGNN